MEVTALTQRCLHIMKQQARCKITSNLRRPQAISSRPYSHFPARRKTWGTRLTFSGRSLSTSRRVLQDPPSQQQSSTASPFPPSSTTPSTAPKPSIMSNLTKRLRSQSSEYVPDTRPLAEQLGMFGFKPDIMDVMGSDRTRRPPRSASSPEEQEIDQEALWHNLNTTSYSQKDQPKVNLRLKPALGRTQPLDLTRNIDLTAAFRKVERKCADNNVKTDARTQKIYVRRGQRRKDDRRRRWRVLFKEGFLHECARIRRMKAQGW